MVWWGVLSATKIVHRKMGKVTALRKVPLEKAQEFYKLAKSMTSEEIKALCQRTIVATKTTTTRWAENGQFLPLEVRAKAGWDAEKIKAGSDPEDIRYKPKYGRYVYRVPIEETGEGVDNKVEDGISFNSKKKTKALKRRRTEETEDASAAGSSQEFSTKSRATKPRLPRRRKQRRRAKARQRPRHRRRRS